MNDRELEEALVGRLRLLSGDEPDLGADVRAAQRARLVAMAAVRTPATRSPEVEPSWWRRVLTARPDDAAPAPWRTRVTAGLVGAAMTVGALSGLVAVAQGAEPGDLLYGLKRGSEQTQLALASDSDRGLTLLTFASTRLAELTELTGDGAGALPAATVPGMPVAAGADAGTVVDVLATMDEQTTEGTSAFTATAARDSAALTQLALWAAGQRAGLSDLSVPDGANGALTASIALVDRVAARAADLQSALACPDGAAAAGSDDLGQVPGACLPAPAPSTAPDPGSTTAPTTTAAPPTASAGPTAVPAPTTGGGATATQGGGGAGATGGAGSSGGGATGGGGGATGGGAQPTGVPVPTVPLPLPTTAAPTTPPLVQVPLPLPSATVCVGGLICIGG